MCVPMYENVVFHSLRWHASSRFMYFYFILMINRKRENSRQQRHNPTLVKWFPVKSKKKWTEIAHKLWNWHFFSYFVDHPAKLLLRVYGVYMKPKSMRDKEHMVNNMKSNGRLFVASPRNHIPNETKQTAKTATATATATATQKSHKVIKSKFWYG